MQLQGDKMTTRPSIKNEQEHKIALAAIEQLFSQERGSRFWRIRTHRIFMYVLFVRVFSSR